MNLLKTLFTILIFTLGCVDQNKNTYGEFSCELDGVVYKNYGVFANQSMNGSKPTYALRTENLDEKEFGLVLELVTQSPKQMDFKTIDMPTSSISIYDEKDDGLYTISAGEAKIIEKSDNSISVNFEATFINSKDSNKIVTIKNGIFKIKNLNPASSEQ